MDRARTGNDGITDQYPACRSEHDSDLLCQGCGEVAGVDRNALASPAFCQSGKPFTPEYRANRRPLYPPTYEDSRGIAFKSLCRLFVPWQAKAGFYPPATPKRREQTTIYT